MNKDLVRLFVCFLFLLVNFSFPAYSFDGSDTQPPNVVSMKLVTSPPSMQNEQIAIEVITQDDKNWVKLTGKPQLGYSFAVTNNNAAPNCSTVTNVFSTLEVIEDDGYRAKSTNTNKTQRFFLIGFIPKPKAVPGNCPEYRNLAAAPVVALNTGSFISVVDKNTKIKTLQSNILTPAIQDESGRSKNSSPYAGLSASSLTFANQNVGITSQFCINAAQLPKNNASIASIQSKYIEQTVKALNANATFEPDPIINFYQDQVSVWGELMTEFSEKTLKKLNSCSTPLTTSQIIGSYQGTNKFIENAIASATKNQLLQDCQATNADLQGLVEVGVLLRNIKAISPEQTNLSNKIRSLRLLDCAKVNSKALSDSKQLTVELRGILEPESKKIIEEFCQDRNSKLEKYDALLKALKFRFNSTNDLLEWEATNANLKFDKCDPLITSKELVTYLESTNKLIISINELLMKLQKLEKAKEIKWTIRCKFKGKTVVRSGKPPKCPSGYAEIKLALEKVV